MAKNIGVVQYSGTLGNTVGAKKSAGQKANTIRIKPTSTKVSYTGSLLYQRMRVRGASNFYTALNGILDHSFQNVEYGAPSHNHFMKLALQNDILVRVAIKKGSNNPLPFAFKIAEGNAPLLEYGMANDKGYIAVANDATAESSLYDAFADLYPSLKSHDQITIVACIARDIVSDGEVIYERIPNARLEYVVRRMYYDEDQTIGDFFEDFSPAVANGKLSLTIANGTTIAFAVIVSRAQENVGGTTVKWERSNATMVLSQGWADALDQPTYIDACRNSYKKAAATTDSPWYLNGGDNE